jgi:hypothetical protein
MTFTAARSNITMPNNVRSRKQRIPHQQRTHNLGKLVVLSIGVRNLIRPLELNPNREVIASRPRPILRLPRMPRPRPKRNKLHNLPPAPNQDMS